MMLDMDVIVQRLSAQVGVLRSVGGAASLETVLKNGARVTPSAFVVLLSESPAAQQLAIKSDRVRMTIVFAVAICVQDFSDSYGSAALTAGLTPVRQDVIAALQGFRPLPAVDYGIMHSKGNLLQIRGGHVIWQDVFTIDLYRYQ